MNPIPTTNAMKPAAGKGIPSFPTPVIKDTVIVEVVNAWKGDYVPLEYGAKWDDHPHASQQGSFPDHKLISQAPTSEDGQWVKRIWANDRVDQDTYNYAIKYSAGSDAHPIYIRTYLEPRDTYAPRLDNSPDPLFPSAVLVDEEVTRTEGEFDSRYVQVTRVYETLPGPVVPTKRINERGDLETINTQTVAPGTQPDPDGLLVTQTQVAQEEVSKGVKTTATVPSHSQLLIKEKKEGLLGETITTDDIVDPSTAPDALSQTIVASVVQQTSSTKAVKRTTTATGPTSLTGKQNKEGLLGKVTIKEEIVPLGSEPDPLNFTTVSSEVTPIDSAKAKKTTVTSLGPTSLGQGTLTDSPAGLIDAFGSTYIAQIGVGNFSSGGLYILKNSTQRIDDTKYKGEFLQVQSWPELKGVEYDEVLGIPIKYSEQVVSPSEYENLPSWQDQSNKSYKPLDKWKTMRRTYNKDEIIDALTSQYYAIETQTSVTLPDKLLSATIYWSLDKGKATGSDDVPAVTDGSYSYSQSYSRRSSANVSGDIYFKIEKGFSGTLPATEHIFFMPISEDGTVVGSVLEALNVKSGNATTEKKWNWQTNQYVTTTILNPGAYVKWPFIKRITENIVIVSGSKSKTESWTIGETVSINGFSRVNRKDDSFDIDRNANTITVPDTIHDIIPIQDVRIGDFDGIDFAPEFNIYPPALDSTSITRFPAGKYLISANMELYKWGLVKVTAVTVDITEDYT
jgi:hypothetical protein